MDFILVHGCLMEVFVKAEGRELIMSLLLLPFHLV